MRRRTFLASLSLVGAASAPGFASRAGDLQRDPDPALRDVSRMGQSQRGEGIVFLTCTSAMREVAGTAFVLAGKRLALTEGNEPRLLLASGNRPFGSEDWLSEIKRESDAGRVRAIVAIAQQYDPEVAASGDALREHERHLVMIEPALVDLGGARFPSSHPVVAVDMNGRLTIQVPSVWGMRLMELWEHALPGVGVEDLFRLGIEFGARDRAMLADLAVEVVRRVSRAADPRTDLMSQHVATLKTERDGSGEISGILVVPAVT